MNARSLFKLSAAHPSPQTPAAAPPAAAPPAAVAPSPRPAPLSLAAQQALDCKDAMRNDHPFASPITISDLHRQMLLEPKRAHLYRLVIRAMVYRAQHDAFGPDDTAEAAL